MVSVQMSHVTSLEPLDRLSCSTHDMIELPSHGNQEAWLRLCQIFKDFRAISELNHDTLIALFSATSGVDCNAMLDNLMECLLEGKEPRTAVALIHGIIDAACQLDNLFPCGTLSQLDHVNDHIAYSRSQVRCLLAHMFLGTLKPLWNESSGLYRTSSGEPIHQKFPRTFLDWYQSKHFREQSKIYIRTILNYFQHAVEDTHTIDFHLRKRSLEPSEWMDSEQKICPVQIRTQGRIGDLGANFEVDFANKQVGFGQGATQEELILGTSPESCVVVLISQPMEDDSVIEIKGCEMFGDYTGFGASAKFCPRKEDKSRDWSQRSILAMDARFYDGLPGDNRFQQLKDEALFRELNKAYCAFLTASGSTIETGPWGCGAFGGDKEIKLIIQILAASKADCRELVLYTFGNVKLSEKLNELLDCFRQRQIGVGKVVRMLCHSRNDIYPSFDLLTWKQREDDRLFLYDFLMEQIDKVPTMF